MTVYRVVLRSVTGREFEREFASMTERELFKLEASTISQPPTVVREYEAKR